MCRGRTRIAAAGPPAGRKSLPAGVALVGNYGGGEIQPVNKRLAASLLLGVAWQKSRYSNPCGSCVEVAQLADGRIAVRNSRYPGGPVLVYPRAEMAAFIHCAKVGEFDDTTGGSMA